MAKSLLKFYYQIAYNFNYHPKTIKEYENLLKNIKRLNTVYDVNEIYQFYYIHHHYGKCKAEKYIKDDLFINSFNSLVSEVGYCNLFNNNIYPELIKRIDDCTKDKVAMYLRNEGCCELSNGKEFIE